MKNKTAFSNFSSEVWRLPYFAVLDAVFFFSNKLKLYSGSCEIETQPLVSNLQLSKLQHVQNTAARLICNVSRFGHISPVLFRLQWLPVQFRISNCIVGTRWPHG